MRLIVILTAIFIVAGLLILSLHLPKSWLVYSQSGPPVVSFGTYVTYDFNLLKHPTGLVFAEHPLLGTPSLFIADTGNHVIRVFTPGSGLGVLAGKVGTPGYADGDFIDALFNMPTGFVGETKSMIDPITGKLIRTFFFYVSDGANYVVRFGCFGTLVGGALCRNINTLAGSHTKGYLDGSSSSARFATVGGVSDPDGLIDQTGPLYVADSENHSIRRIYNNEVTTFAGVGSPGFLNGNRTGAKFNCPTKLAWDNNGNMYVTDAGNYVIRKIDTSGNVTTFAGTGEPGYADGAPSSAQFRCPTAIIFNSGENVFYVSDSLNNMIRRIDLAGNVSTYAGKTVAALVNGSLAQAQFACPSDIAIFQGSMYLSDTLNNVIRRIDMANGVVFTYIS